MKQRRSTLQDGQSVLEYVVLIAAAVLVIVIGQLYFKRALHGRWKETADQVGDQFTSKLDYTIETQQSSSRLEETGTPGQVTGIVGVGGAPGTDPNWTQSTVKTAAAMPKAEVGAVLDYKGHEITKTDFVTERPGGAQAAGTHTTFDSGVLSTQKLFDDD